MKATDLQFRENNGEKVAVIFRAAQFTDTDPDPTYSDLSYHLTEKEAKEAADKIKIDVGSCPIVDMISFHPEDLPENFELEDLDDRDCFFEIETIGWGPENQGDEIEGSIIVEWSWEKYVGYARNLKNVGVAGKFPFQDFETEKDLISGNEDRLFHSNYSILLTKDEIDSCNNLEEEIYNAIGRDYWKWNSFKNNPNSEHIKMAIDGIL